MMPISINIQKAGALEEKIKGYSSKNIQYLQLVGFINESDIEVIDSLKELTILDISNAQIVVDGTQNDIIGDRMFSECCFSSITLPNGIRSIGKQAFRYGKLTNITIPDSTVVIGRLAFLFCSNLETVTMGKGVQIIGNNAFAHCEKIQSIIIPEKVTSIGGAAFRNCCNLEEIKVKGQIKFIGKGAFGNCSKLSRIYSEQFIPLSYEMFDEDNIHSCSIYIQGKKYSILDYINQISFDQKSFSTFLPIAGSLKHITFYSCGIQELKLAGFINGDDVLAIREWHFSRFRNLDLSNVQIVEGGSAYYEERRSISRGASLRTQIFKHVTNCNEIGPYMFCNCSFYRIILPKESVSIRNRAFENCSNLETIIIGENVEEIGDKAFYRCTKLSQINIPNGVKKVYSHAFGDCRKLNRIEIPDNVVQIQEGTFSECINLERITIGKNVRNISKDAFAGCKKIAAIYCKGLPPQIDETFFENIDISNCKLYAKSCYLNDYKNDRYWKLFIKEEKKVESKSTYYTINECLTPITMFDDFFKRHQNEFIYQKGRKQYDDLYDKIRKASKLKELCRMSIQYGVAPNAEDFKIVAMFGSTWFGFNQKLTRMGALIALKIWDETVNMEKQLASDIALYNKAQSIIRITS